MVSFKPMFYQTFTILSVLPIVLCQESGAVKSLCEDTYIHCADRLPNNTYRVYRGDYYWELVGLPVKEAIVRGPYPIWYKNMAPMTKDSSVFTVVGGGIHGFTYKFKGERFWIWNRNGIQRAGGKEGNKWSAFPKGGFSAAYNDGDLDQKGYPMLVAFYGIRVYYFNTNGEVFRPIGPENGTINGAFNEKFPTDLTAAMPFKSVDSDAKYHVYLFKRDKYCYRPIIGEEDCKNWRNNKELFGCLKAGTSKPINNETATEIPKPPEETTKDDSSDQEDDTSADEGIEDTTKRGQESQSGLASSLFPNQNFVLLLLTIISVKYFFQC